MTVPPMFSYFGAKHRIAKHYPPPQHGRIVEPFAGSAAYACQYPHLEVVLNDLDPVVAGVWRYLINADPKRVLDLPDVRRGQLLAELNVEPVERDLIGFWVSTGCAYPARRASGWMATYPSKVWGAWVRERIAANLHRIRHWKVTELDYSQLPMGCSTWFVDPPYVDGGMHYRKKSRDIDYPALATWCRALPGQVMVCERADATWLPFRPFRVAKAQVGTIREGLWESRPSQLTMLGQQ